MMYLSTISMEKLITYKIVFYKKNVFNKKKIIPENCLLHVYDNYNSNLHTND